MKKLLTTVVIMALHALAYSQANTVNTNVTAQQLANHILGTGVDLISATYVGNSASKGIYTTNALPQMSDGIILSTGLVNTDIFKTPANENSHSLGTSGDPDLQSLYSGTGYDAASLEVVIRPRGTKISFQYVFASEEYPSYVCQANDMFGLLIKQNTANATYQNIAIVPGTNYPISINTIHGNASPCSGYPQTYGQYFQVPTSNSSFIFNGRTVVLTAEYNVIPCQEYKLKFAIHDQLDGILNSAIYIKANSLNSTGVTINSNNYANISQGNTIYKNCEKDTLKITRSAGIVDDLDFSIQKSGTAVEGTDYLSIVDSFKILSNQQQYVIPIIPIGTPNNNKQFVLKFYRKLPNCNGGVELIFVDSIVYNITDFPKPSNLANITLCNNANYQLNLSNANNYDSIRFTPNTNLSSYTTFNPIFSGANTQTYFVSVYKKGCNRQDSFTIFRSQHKIINTNDSICASSLPYTWKGKTVNSVGTHTLKDSLLTSMGCDSVHVLTLKVFPNPTNATVSQTICQQSLPFYWNGQTVNTVGNHTLTFIKKSVVSNCDSLTTLTLTVNPTKLVNITNTICQQNLPFNWNGITINTVGNYTLYYTKPSVLTGCDSVTTLILTVNPTKTTSISNTICQQNLPYTWNGQTVNTVGNHTLTYTKASVLTGCDSTTALTLTVNPTKTASISNTICQQNLPYVWNGQTINTVGNHTLTFTKASVITGCDSITTLTLTVNPTKTLLLKDTICQSSLPFVWNGQIINTAGAHTLVYNTNSLLTTCDSITTLNLFVRQNPVVNLGPDRGECVNQGWSHTLNAGNNGVDYLWNTLETTPTINIAQNGMYHVKVTNAFGCFSYDTILVNFRTNPIVNLIPDTNLCVGDSIMLDATYANAAAYNWNTSATTPTITVKTGGKYVVQVVSNNGCISKDSTTITLRENPILDLGPDVTKCINTGDLHFIDAGNPGLNYLWDNNYNGQVRVVNTSGQYWAKITNTWQCFDTDTINVTLKNNPEVHLGNDTNICEDGFMVLDAGNTGINYYWNTGATSPQVQINTGGSYFVAVTGANGCLGGDTINITQSGKMPKYDNIWITNLASHKFKFSVLNPQHVIGYYWDFGDGSAPQYSATPTHSYAAHGNYVVTLHVSSSCGIFTDTSTVHIYTTGTDDFTNSTANVKVYPNPSNGAFTLETSDMVFMKEILIINPIGQIVYKVNAEKETSKSLQLEKLPAGNYHLKITTNKGVLHEKLIIAH